MSAAFQPRAPEGRPPQTLTTFELSFTAALERVRARRSARTFASLVEYSADPVRFAAEIVGIEGDAAWDKQNELLVAIRDHDRISVRAAQKISKSFVASLYAVFWLCTGPPGCKVVFSSPTAKQVRITLYGQMLQFIAAIRRRHPGLLDGVRAAMLPETGIQGPDFRYIVGVTAHDDGSIAGLGGKDTLWVLDEGSHIKESIYQAVEGNCASGGCKILAISNPRLTFNWFFDSHNKNKEFWHCIHLSGLDSINYRLRREVVRGLCTYEYIEKRRRQWGEDSAQFQILCLGNFAIREENRMFPFQRVQDAIDRWDSTVADGPLRVGADVAGASQRADESALAFVRGKKLIDLATTRSLDTDALVAWMLSEIARWRLPGEVPELRVDVEGSVGAQVLGALRHQQKLTPNAFRVVPVSSSDHAIRNRKALGTVRDEMADALEKWVRDGGALIDDPLLLEELAVMEWLADTKGRNKLLPKSDIKAALGRSCDRFDALCLAMPDGSGDATALMKRQLVQRDQQVAVQRVSSGRRWDIRQGQPFRR